jgi:integrase
MKGRIIKRKGSKNYTIVLQLGLDPATGKRKQQWITANPSKREAEKQMAELIHQMDTGTFVKPNKNSFSKYLEEWLKGYVWPNLSPRTAEGYESIVRCHLIPALGNIPLTQLRPEHLQRYYSEKLSVGRYDRKGALSQTTVSHHHTCIHRALKMALRWGLISRNPADAVVPPRPQRSEMHTMTEDEISIFLEAAKKTPYYVLFYVALFTGMRRSELLALRWGDVDLLLCQAHINRSLHHLRTGDVIFRAPKTTKARRMVSLPPSSAFLLQEHKDKQEAKLRMPLREDDLIFSNHEGKPLLPDTISHAWTKLVKRTGLNRIRLHDARHTHASLLLKQSVHPKIVQERLGHATISTTLDLYSHISPGLQEAAAIGFDKLINRKERDGVRK